MAEKMRPPSRQAQFLAGKLLGAKLKTDPLPDDFTVRGASPDFEVVPIRRKAKKAKKGKRR